MSGILQELPEMPPEEKEWFKTGIENGWLIWYSICSTHFEPQETCVRCNTGSWHLGALGGMWIERKAGGSVP